VNTCGFADVLAIVPARGGSKGIPRKNLHPFRGRPLIDYTLEALTRVPELTHVLISSDDEEIRQHCSGHGFATEYKRPEALATDDSPIMNTVLDGMAWAERWWHRKFTYVMLVQPTSPLRTHEHIHGFLRELCAGHHEALVSVSPMSEHPMECLVVTDGAPEWHYLVEPPASAHGRQAYRGSYYFINGALYAATPRFLERQRTFLVPHGTALFEMSRASSLDIDTPEDLDR
jgi:N-acylneuraminate cytidylyltransferase/CMP-N,N'-diacetyllegionaminic acid synthase